ncbi:DUF5895 domain-containing protein [Gloeocapsopsis sp. IPPAS B-1203]|uniref:DUF5895 domain-containing protein n=1 Tax=Gloeocapsopsis sp. IPPAS B-1203 TaxID=2049454 RepID=UPI000C1A66CC|nr:DUF5895 domain-containing protein [Gloeocapsopsis sp. IPPAS B-1203]PIG91720.1 hypothetical protein CSQ79_19450 [Gloeocapsopsis sp. IPPAS B-1203]
MVSAVMHTPSFDFDDDKFKAPASEILPWCQMINPQWSENGIKPYGLAITQENANVVGFTPDENWQQVEYTFGSGEIAQLFITTTPRILVLHRGPVCIKDRTTNTTLGRLVDHYDAFAGEKLKYKTFMRYLVFLVGKNQKLLHHSPLRLTLSGAAGASFSIAFRTSKNGQATSGFTLELEKAYAAFRQQPFTAKSKLFYAHGVFCPNITSEERGIAPNKALVAVTVDYEHPTAENLANYLIPTSSEESTTICQTFETYQDFAKEPKLEVALPEIEETTLERFDEYDFDAAPY